MEVPLYGEDYAGEPAKRSEEEDKKRIEIAPRCFGRDRHQRRGDPQQGQSAACNS